MSDNYNTFGYWQQFPCAMYRRIELIQADLQAKASEHQSTSLCQTTLTAMIRRKGHQTRHRIGTMCNLDPADDARYAWAVFYRHRTHFGAHGDCARISGHHPYATHMRESSATRQ